MELTKEKGIAIAAILAVIIMATAVFPFWNLLPREVTETQSSSSGSNWVCR